jgi:hypothetical protein
MQAMNFLLLEVLCGFEIDTVNAMLKEGFIFYILYLTYLLFGSLTIMNMLIGVLCEVVSSVAEVERDKIFNQEVDTQIEALTKALDEDGNGVITFEEFQQVMQEDIIWQLNDIGVDVVAFADFASFIFHDSDHITHHEFGQMVAQFRGYKAATVKDLADVRKYVSLEMALLEGRIEAIHRQAMNNHMAINANKVAIRSNTDRVSTISLALPTPTPAAMGH